MKGTCALVFNQPRPVERAGKAGIGRIRGMLTIKVFNAQIQRQSTRTPVFQTIFENAGLHRLHRKLIHRPTLRFLLVF